MSEVVSCVETPSAEFANLTTPTQHCDEPLPPYKIIKPVYDGHFTDTCPQIDTVSHTHCPICKIITGGPLPFPHPFPSSTPSLGGRLEWTSPSSSNRR